MTVRIGVIGTGNMGADHIRNLQKFVPGAQVTVVADENQQTVAAVAAESGARIAVNGDELIADRCVDAVIIAAHDSTHFRYAMATIKAGKPTLCEKPLAPTVAECEALATADESAGNLISLGFMRRFDPAHTELKAAVDAGVVGPVLRITGASRNVVSYPGTTSESIITNSVIHELDSIPWLLGSEVVEVAWLAGRASSKVPDGVADPSLTLLRTADGVLTSIDMYVNAEYGYDLRCEVLGETGAISLRDPALIAVDSGLRQSTSYPLDWRPRFAVAYRLELAAWLASIETGDRGELASAADGLAAARVAEAVITSMHADGRWVKAARCGDSR